MVNQISVFVENTTGRLTKFTKVLADENINMDALCIAETVDYGILRCIVDKPEKAKEVLKKSGFTSSITKVIAAGVDDIPGGFHAILKSLSAEGINIKYAYSVVRPKDGRVVIIMKVDDTELAEKVLQEAGTNVYSTEDLVD
jgi:hypothetical protein